MCRVVPSVLLMPAGSVVTSLLSCLIQVICFVLLFFASVAVSLLGFIDFLYYFSAFNFIDFSFFFECLEMEAY